MLRTRTGAAVRCCVITAAAALCFAAGAPAASAHDGGSKCDGTLAGVGASYQGVCEFPFQGFPLGVAGRFTPGEETRGGEIHVELLAHMATGGPPRALGVECEQVTETGVARCTTSYNPLTQPLTAPEPVPGEIVSISCEAHSHALYSRLHPPSGRFACWSTNEALADLEADGVMEEIGYAPGEAGGNPGGEPAPGPADGLPSTGASSLITTVPYNTYAPDTVPVVSSQGLRYINVDTARHDVVAKTAKRPDGSAPWCEDYGSGECPLFWTPLIPGGGSEATVQGLEDAAPGSYDFFCTIHPYMVGKIEVVS
jgi:plastocyanin